MVTPEKIHYKRNLLLSLILSESLLIFAFIFSPESGSKVNEVIMSESIFTGEIIPPTVQLLSKRKPPPKVPVPVISDEVDAFDLLDDVKILSSETVSDNFDNETTTLTGIVNTSPRLTYEVLPQNKGYLISGALFLSLKIDKTGKVIEHKILQNSLDCKECIGRILTIAYQTKWEPAYKNGAKTDDWVQKSYVFN